MAWITIKPENTGGGRTAAPPSARMHKDGALVMSAACMKLLGETKRVLVQVEPTLRAIRLTPTTPTNTGAFSINGGGGATPPRVSLRKAVRKWPSLVGVYGEVKRIAGGVELRQTADARPAKDEE